MFCPNCGTKVEEGSFCTECGEALPTQDEGVANTWEQPDTFYTQAQQQATTQAPYTQQQQVASQATYVTQPLPTPAAQQVAPLVTPQAVPQMAPQVAPPQMAPGPYTPQQPMPAPLSAPIAPEQAEAGKPKPNAARIALFSAAGIVILIIAIIGISALMRANKYNTAVQNYDAGEDIFIDAESIEEFEAAYELYDKAHTAFSELDQYKESVTYVSRAETKLNLCQQHIDYLTAMQMFEDGDFEAAMQIFRRLGSFQNSATMIEVCRMSIDLEEAIALYEAGDLEASHVILSTLKTQGFEEAVEWYYKVSYELAERYLNNGDKYGAYRLFMTIQGYSDAKDRAWQCTDPYPGSSVLYQNDSYRSSAVRLVIDGSRLTLPVYLKIYRDGYLVASIFINAGDSVTINLSAGSYRIHEATGGTWFGEDIMFGGDGFYAALVFEDGAAETYLATNYIYTFTIGVSDGNIGTDSLNPRDF